MEPDGHHPQHRQAAQSSPGSNLRQEPPLRAALARKLRLQLAALHSATQIEDMDLPGYRLHQLKGADKGRWSIWVNGNWRLTFAFRDGHVFDLDFEDYH
jgi:toxin HigB-1